jgi:uncharacterized protein
MLEDLLFFIVAIVSEVIGALALFFVDFQTALILVAISHLFGNLGRINFFKQGLDKKIIATFGIPSILFSFLGASIVGILSQDILKIVLGMFLIIISSLFLVRSSLKVPTRRSMVITGGGISGLITGLVGTGGALRATFLTGFNLEKTRYIATAAVIALGTDATRIPSYLSQGFLLQQYYYYIPILAATAIGGSYIGKKIVGKIDQNRFRKNVLAAIIIVSINFIITGSLSMSNTPLRL